MIKNIAVVGRKIKENAIKYKKNTSVNLPDINKTLTFASLNVKIKETYG